jgi:hypothetical protein
VFEDPFDLPVGALIHFQAVAQELGRDADTALATGGLSDGRTDWCLKAIAPPKMDTGHLDGIKIKVLHSIARNGIGARPNSQFEQRCYQNIEAFFRVCIAHNLGVEFAKP